MTFLSWQQERLWNHFSTVEPVAAHSSGSQFLKSATSDEETGPMLTLLMEAKCPGGEASESPDRSGRGVVNLRSEGHSGSRSERDERENGRNSASNPNQASRPSVMRYGRRSEDSYAEYSKGRGAQRDANQS